MEPTTPKELDDRITQAEDYDPKKTKPLTPQITKLLTPETDQQQLQSELKPVDKVAADLTIQGARDVETTPKTTSEIPGATMLTLGKPEATAAKHITINFSLEPDPSKPELGSSIQAFQTPNHTLKDTLYIQPRFLNGFGQQVYIKASPDCLYFNPSKDKFVSFLNPEKSQDSTILFESGSKVFVLIPTTNNKYVRLYIADNGSNTTIEHTGIVTKDQISQPKQ
jgi:hypothetical protein